MKKDADGTKQNARDASDTAPDAAGELERKRGELAELIGQMLAAHWLRPPRPNEQDQRA
jgi:hypothetical protein